LENIALFEYQDSLTKKNIFDYSIFKINRKNCFISKNPKISENNLALVYTSNGGLNNQLVVLEKGNPTPLDSISDVYSFEWFNNSLLLYTKENNVKRSDKLFCNNINSQVDSLLLFETDLTFDLELKKTKSYLVCSVQSMNENEFYLTSKKDGYPNFHEFLKRETSVYSTLKEFNKTIYILTNKNALNNKLLVYKNDSFKEIVSPHNDIYIQDFLITNNYIVLKAFENSFGKIKYKQLMEKKLVEVDFKHEIFEADFDILKGDKLSISFSTPSTPYTNYTFDLNSHSLTRVKNQELNYAFKYDPRYIQTKRIWAKSKDGVKIPMTIIKNSAPK